MLLFCLLPLMLVLTSAADLAEVEVIGSTPVQKRALHLCGGELANAIQTLCYQRRRRSDFDTLPMDQWLEMPASDVTSSADMTSLRQTFFTPHSQETRLFASNFRTKRGIVETCCVRGCSLSTLLMFC